MYENVIFRASFLDLNNFSFYLFLFSSLFIMMMNILLVIILCADAYLASILNYLY